MKPKQQLAQLLKSALIPQEQGNNTEKQEVNNMVYNTTYQPSDLAGIFQDMFGAFLQNIIVYAGLIVLVIIVILIIRNLRGR
jgi:hypothetical protein